MPVWLESFVGVGFLVFFAAGSVVGARLLVLWRRTREHPELLIGLSVLGIGPVGFGLLSIGELCAVDAPGPARILIGVGLASVSVGCAATYVFNWRVYHPSSRVIGKLVVIACLLSAACLGWEYTNTGFRSMARPGSSHFLRIGLLVGCLLWGSVESLRYCDRMRRRVRIGLADPVVANRFLLWGLGAGAASLSSAVVGVTQWWTGLHPIDMPWVMLFSSASGLVASSAMWLAFVPSERYTRWIRARAAI